MNTFRPNSPPRGVEPRAGWLRLAVAMLWVLFCAGFSFSAVAQFDNCTATVLNRSVLLGPGGSLAIPNVPWQQGYFRVRVTCISGGVTTVGQSDYFQLNPSGPSTVGPIHYGQISPMPVSIAITSPKTTLTTKGETVQLAANVTFANGSIANASTPLTGTLWISSNPDIATITPEGLVTAVARGPVILQAINEGVQSAIQLTIQIPIDADSDGMSDEFENGNGLNPNDPSDAGQDLEGDGLTNIQEFERGTNPRSADTDGDGLLDGDEIVRGSNPLLADTDGDGLTDGQEVLRGSSPFVPDTDSDGIPDGLEVQLGLNLTNANPVTTVEGRVLDTASVAVAGAAVTLFNLITVNTDTNGFFSFANIPAGLGSLTVSAQIVRAGKILDGVSAAVNPIAGGLTSIGNVEVGLNAGTVAGIITDPFGAAVAGALVTVTSGADVRTATANSAGQYRISNMTAGDLVITARDYRTGLRGRVLGNLPLNDSAEVNLQLGPFGTVRGTVFARDNTTPVGAGANVAFSGGNTQQGSTDPFGKYNFEFVPLGGYSVTANDGADNRGRSGGDVSATSQVNVNDIGFLGTGQVVGTVRDASLNPVANASLRLNSGSVFGGIANTTSDGAGRYTFPSVFVGTYSIIAQAPGSGLAGQVSGAMLSNNQRITNNITVAASGSITGLVFRADGVTPVEGVLVTVSPSGLSTTTGAQGQFRFDVLPLGAYTLNAFETSTGDRGISGASISAQSELANGNITLNGLGSVLVTVRNGASNLVAGAQVSLTGATQFGGSWGGVTAGDGTVLLSGVLAGGFNLSATDPVTGFSGHVFGSVAVGATAAITVRLQSFGSVRGLVFQPDGTTPASGITVRISGQVSRNTVTQPDGSFQFDVLPTSTYTIEASDSGGVRARESGVVLNSQGQEVSRNLTLIGLGTVEGIVRNPDSSPAANLGVTLAGQASGFSRTLFALTDILGHYSISGVPVGAFTVTSRGQTANSTLYGSTPGTVASHEQAVAADIQLSATLIPVTTTLYDANNFGYQLRESGAIQDGSPGSMWAGDFSGNRGGFILELMTNGTPHLFVGQEFGSVEDGGREIVIQQDGLAGLNVTRKVFVPREGYFARYLEILNNPSDAPIVVGVRLTSNFRFIQKVQDGFTVQREPRIVGTSSGDLALGLDDPNARDRWVIIDDDEDLDPFLVGSSLPAVGNIFEGPGGALQTDTAQYNIDFTARYGKLVETWTNVTVQPGGTVALMHFGFQQVTRSTATASAQRLVQLPPEALAGMTLTEMAQVLNFAVPANGVSALPPLPPINGSISGRTLVGDGSNIVANAGVRFRSESLYFGRTWSLTANGAGLFSFLAQTNGLGNSLPIPTADFTLVGSLPFTTVVTPPIPGSFPFGFLTATQDVVFSNAGVLVGTVRRHNGVVVSSGTVRITGEAILNSITLPIAANGTFRINGLPAGLNTLVVTTPIIQGSDLVTSTTVNITGGQTTTVDVIMPATGTISGLVSRQDASPGVNSSVILSGTNGLSRSTSTDTGGRFTFFDVPEGPVTLAAFDPLSNTAAQAQTNAVMDQNVVANMSLIFGGTVAGLVTINGLPVNNAQVTVTANNGVFNTPTGSDGRYSLFPVEPGPVSVKASDPASLLRGQNSGTLSDSGNTLTLNMQLFASGTVTGIVYRTDGVTPIPNALVTLSESTYRNTTTGSEGQYSFDVVPLGFFELSGSDPGQNEFASGSGTLSANLQTLNVNLVMTPSIRITDASVVERNVGTTNALFNVNLSSPSQQEVRVNYATANSTAVIGDYLASSGTVIFAPGVTSQPVNVTVVGDVTIEPNEVFRVNLSGPVNGTIADNQGTGTIVNDDGFAGQVNHFVWSSIPAAQFINESFPVTVTAQDAFSNVVTDFTGPVTLAGVTAAQDLTVGSGNVPWNFPLASFYHDARLQSIYLAGELGQARNITGLALDVAGVPGQTLNNWTIRLKHTPLTSYGLNPGWDGSGWTTVLQTNLTVNANGWLVLPFAVPFQYNGSDNLMIDFSFNNSSYTGDGSTRSTDTALNRSLFFRTDSGAGDPLGWSGVSPVPNVIARVPNIRLIGSEAGVVMTPLVSGGFTGGSWTGNITVQQLATNLVLRADDGDGHIGASAPVEVLIRNDLVLNMIDAPDPVQIGGQLTYILTVTNTGPLDATGVIVSNRLPATATFVSAFASQGTCSNIAGLVRCDLGTIPGGTSVQISIVATPTLIGNITNSASVSRTEVDPFPANNSAAVATTVLVPSLTIDDVSAPEGNSVGSSPVFTFNIRLSYPNSQTVTVNYFTTNGTALATADYAATNGLISLLPGQTNRTVQVRIIGDTSVEPNETFFVVLSNSVNATISDDHGLGTILNDDGLPGQIDHFEWAAIPSPQFANEALPVSVLARDGSGNIVSDFAGPVNLTALVGVATPGRILGDMIPVSSSSSGNYTLGYSFTPNTNLTVTHVRHYFGSKVSIWTANGILLASQDVISTPGTWVETELASPLNLTAGVTYRVAAYTTAAYYYRFDASSVFSNGVINASYQRSGDGFPTTSDGVRWWMVDLKYTAGTQVDVPLNPAISGNFSNGIWNGSVTLATLGTNVSLMADDGDGHSGRSGEFTMLYRNDVGISVTDTPDPVGTGSGLTYVVTVTNTGPSSATGVFVTNRLAATASYVSSSVSQGSAVPNGQTVQWTVGTLAAGSTASLTIQATPTTSGVITNDAGVTRAEADAFAGNNFARQTTTVLLPTLTVSDVNVVEGNVGTQDAVFAVQLSYPSAQVIQVLVATTNGSALAGVDYLPVNRTVTFAAGQTLTNITIQVLGENVIEVNENFFLTLSSPLNATIADGQGVGLIINDDGIPGQISHFEWAAIPSPQNAGEPFPVTVTAKDSFGDTVTDFTDSVALSAAIGGSVASNRILGDVFHTSASSGGNFTLGYSFTPNTNIVVTHVRNYFGSKVSIWTDSGVQLASQPVSSTGSSWVETPLPTPLTLTNGMRYRVAAFTGSSGGYRWRSDGAGLFPNGTIDANHETSGDAFPTGNSGSARWMVDLRYNVGSSLPLPIIPANSAPFVAGVWSGSVTIQGAGENAVLTASDGNGHSGDANPILVIRQNDLSIAASAGPLPADVRSNLTYTITVTNTGPSAATAVMLSNTLPLAVNFVSVNASQGSASRTGSLITASLGTLAGGGSATVTIVVRPVMDAITLTNVCSVTRAELDADPANNSVTIMTPVRALFGGGGKVAVFGADNATYYTDVRNKILATGLFSTVDAFSLVSGSSVPTLSQLLAYDSVLVYDNNNIGNGTAVSDVLADYVDNGGGLVVATFAFHVGDLPGRLTTGNYLPFTMGSQTSGSSLSLVKDDPQHPILEGVNNFSGGSSSYHHVLSVASGATQIARWSNNRPLVAVRQTGNGRVVGLNFFPPSSTVSGDFWQAGTDGARLMANALAWAAPGTFVVPDDLALHVSESSDPVAVGSNLIYTLTITNSGPSAATGVFVTNVVPQGANLISFAASQGTITESQGVLVGNLGTVPGGTNATITVAVQTLSVGTLTNVAALVRAEPDGYLRNDSRVSLTSVQVPTLSIGDTTLVEGDAGNTNAVFTVSLSLPSPLQTSVAYSTFDNSALAGLDYVATNGVLVFSPGQTNLTINVSIVNDLRNEATESFSVSLLNATNAFIADTFATGTIQDNDPIPAFSIGDVQITERNTGTTNAEFIVLLSSPSGRTVSLNYNVASGTAQAHVDYVPTNGFISFSAGQTSQIISVPIIGDTAIESNETFFVDLFSASNASIDDNQGVGTILNDDGMAGQIHRFTWSVIPSPQYVGEPFPAAITAQDAFGTTLTGFAGPVLLTGVLGAGQATDEILGDVIHNNSFSGDYSVGYSFTPSTNLVVTYVRHYSGSKVSIWTDTGILVASQPVVSTQGVWTETPLTEPVVLQAGVRYRLSIYNLGAINYYRSDLPTTFAHGTIHNSYTLFGDGFPNSSSSPRWYFVDLGYAATSIASVPVSPSVTGLFTNGVWSGNLTLQAPLDNLVLTASDGDGHIGKAERINVLLRDDLSVFATASSSGHVLSNLVYSLTVSNSGPGSVTGVTLTNLLPPEVQLQSVTPSQGTFGSVGRVITCNLGTLTGGGSATVTIIIRPQADGLITNVATVAKAQPEGFLQNNVVSVVTRVSSPAGGQFRISSLSTNGAFAIEHNSQTGDDRGGIAVSDSKVFVTGDSTTARFNLGDLSGGVGIGNVYDGLVADIKSATVYLLANGSTPLNSGGGICNTLLELDSATGALNGSSIALSSPVTVTSSGPAVGIFSGYGQIALHTGSRVYSISLPSGVVTDLGAVSALSHQSSESWAYWGVAENYGNEVHLVYVRDFQTIMRTRVPDGTTTTLASFSNLSDMASFTVSPLNSRWYFHHEGTSQFNSGNETLGYADASFEITGATGLPDDISLQVSTSSADIAVGSQLTYVLTVTNSGPSAATGVVVSNVVPAGVNVISSVPSQGSIGGSGSLVVATLGTLAAGSQATVTIVVQTTDAGSLTNVARVTRVEPDTYTPNNRVVTVTDALMPMIWAGGTSTEEGNSGTTDLVFVIESYPASELPVSVDYATVDGTATVGSDYQGASGTLTFNPGETNKTITVAVIGDTLAEPLESLTLQLFNPTNASLAVTAVDGQILNDDVSGAVYLRSDMGNPYGSVANEAAMDRVYGSGNWQDLRYESVDPIGLFSPGTQFIFMEGGDSGLESFGSFLTNNLTALQNWVNAGGRLFVNAAPNADENGLVHLGFNVFLVYMDYTSDATAVNDNHPIFSDPFGPVGSSLGGSSLAHASISGSGLNPLINSLNTGETILAERFSGSGVVLFGGMTPDEFHYPQPEMSNLRANIIAYVSSVNVPQALPPQQLAAPSVRIGSTEPLRLEITGQPGGTCVIETSTDLLHWTPVCTNAFNGTTTIALPIQKDVPQGFYRVRRTP